MSKKANVRRLYI